MARQKLTLTPDTSTLIRSKTARADAPGGRADAPGNRADAPGNRADAPAPTDPVAVLAPQQLDPLVQPVGKPVHPVNTFTPAGPLEGPAVKSGGGLDALRRK
jgi:hypothetical protein